MKWSWKLGSVAGIGLYVHATFLLLLAWVGVTYWLAGGSAAALDGIAFILALFACVVLHELGHALTARRYGIRTPRYHPAAHRWRVPTGAHTGRSAAGGVGVAGGSRRE